MLKILQNEQEVGLSYTVENNLVPTVEELKEIDKNVFYSTTATRYNGLNAADSSSASRSILFANYYLCQGMLESGTIELLSEDDEILSRTNLHLPYAGSDTKRGSINLQESDIYSISGKHRIKNIIDFPTHSSNGLIKKIKLQARNCHFNLAGETFHNNNAILKYSCNNTTSYTDILACVSDDDKLLICNTISKKIILDDKEFTYKNQTMKNIQFFDNNFYALVSVDYRTTGIIKLKKLKFNTTLNIVDFDTEFTIGPFATLSESQAADLRTVIKSYNEKIYVCNASMYGNATRLIELNKDFSINRTISSDIRGYFLDNIVTKKSKNGYSAQRPGTSSLFFDFENFVINSNIDNNNIVKEYEFIYNNKNIFYYYTSNNSSTAKMCLMERVPYKTPLTITFNEPLVKTSEQTMKLILDIEIE